MNETDQIRMQMAQIRRDMHHAVSEVVEEAGSALDWRGYLAAYPWLTVGLGVALGYVLVPRKTRPAAPAPLLAGPTSSRVERDHDYDRERERDHAHDRAPLAAPSHSGPGLLGKAASGLFSLAWPLAIRAAQAYAGGWIESLLAQQQQFGPPPSPTDPRAQQQPGAGPASGGGFPGFSFTGSPTGAEPGPR